MAGSFDHCDKDGNFTFDLIENMRDAYQACEEMHGLIHQLADSISRMEEVPFNEVIDDAMANWLVEHYGHWTYDMAREHLEKMRRMQYEEAKEQS